ncbi:hypothetical protein WJX77_007478 [Trebouxia sp. C0004]
MSPSAADRGARPLNKSNSTRSQIGWMLMLGRCRLRHLQIQRAGCLTHLPAATHARDKTPVQTSSLFAWFSID